MKLIALAVALVLSSGPSVALSEDVASSSLDRSGDALSQAAPDIFSSTEGPGPTGLDFGLRLRAGVSEFTYADLPDNAEGKGAFSWAGGIDFRHGLSNRADFEMGLHYLRREGTLKYEGPVEVFGQIWDGEMETKRIYHYLVIPARLRLDLMSSPARPYVRGGFDLGILLDANLSGDGFLFRELARLTPTSGEDRNAEGVDFGLALGLGYEFPVGPRSAFVELGGELGLLDIRRHRREIRTRSLGVAFGLWLSD